MAIYGRVGEGPPDPRDIEALGTALAHRGERTGEHVREGAALGALQEKGTPERGNPASNPRGTIWAVLDGAIYNTPELEGICRGDTGLSPAGVVARSYEALGPDFVCRLRGAFTLAVMDEEAGRLVLARDQLGQRSLFYHQAPGELLFASELKGLLAARPHLRTPNWRAIHHFLSLRFVPAPRSAVADVRKVPPGHRLVYRPGQPAELTRYWSLSFRNKLDLSESELVEGAREKLEEAVHVAVRGQRSAGAFLSGGLDSSLIVAMMARSRDGFPTFSVGTRHGEFNELPFARQVAEAFGTRQHEAEVPKDILGLLPVLVQHLDEPSDAVGVGKLVASRLATETVPVVLGGDGGDELFAGFGRYRGVRIAGLLALLPRWLRGGLLDATMGVVPASYGYESLREKLRWMRRVGSGGDMPERYARAVSFFRFDHEAKLRLWAAGLRDELAPIRSEILVEKEVRESDAEAEIERMLYADYMMRLPEHSLMLAERLGAGEGVQVRSPFADHELVEYVARFPLRMKVRRSEAKYAERRIARRELPEQIANREKRGFRFPLAAWLAGDLHEPLLRLLDHSSLLKNGVLQRPTLEHLLEEHASHRENHATRLWMLLNLELWYRMVIQGHSQADSMAWVREHTA